MNKLSRREALRGTGVAALAAAGGAALPFVADATNDPLLSLLNRYLAELAWINSYHGDLDGRRELGWDKVEELLDEAIDVNQARCEAMLKQMVKLPAGGAVMTENVTYLPVTPAIHNRRIQAEEREQAEQPRNPLHDYIEPCPVDNEVISGCAKVEQMGHGLVRMWLYTEEAFMEPVKVISAKLVMSAESAREIAAKITSELDAPATDAG